MSKHALRILALALVFAMLIPSLSMIGNYEDENEVMTAMILFPDRAMTNEGFDYAEYVDKVIVPYESFIMAELTQRQKTYLEAMGATIFIDQNLHSIGIDGYSFDTRVGEPVIKEQLRFRPRTGENGQYLVQFVGPIKEEWLDTLQEMGADTISYYPYNAILIETTPDVKTSLGGLNYVQWVGNYHPAYKIRPELKEMNPNVEREVNVITYEHEGIGEVLKVLDKKDIIRITEGTDFGLVVAKLSIDEIERVATLNEVSYIEPDEMMEAKNAQIQWILQTNVNQNRKMWAMGVNGSTQIVAISDTGIDYDHNMYRENSTPFIGIAKGDIYNVTDMTRRKLIRYFPMAKWFDDQGIDPSDNGIPEMEEDADGDGVIEAISDTIPAGMVGTSGHGTTTACTLAGNDTNVALPPTSANDGGAAGAKIFFQDVGAVHIDPDTGAWDDYFIWIPDDYHYLFIFAYEAGARIHSNSWGGRSTDYTLDARNIDKFMWEYPEFLVVFPTGNKETGYPDVGSPATAKSVVSAGWGSSSPNQNNVNGQSSTGPTADGRRKPTVTAPGFATTAMSTGNPFDDDFGAPYIETAVSGGSYGSQAVGGAATLIRDYFAQGMYPTGTAMPGNELNITSALLKALLIASGEMMTGGSADSKFELQYPNNSQGWGRPLLDNVLYFPGDTRKTLVVDNREGLTTGQVVEYEVNVNSANAPLRFALTWNDYPGAVGASPATVNDLNLQVEAPNGTTTFWGNRFVQTPFGPGAWDRRGYSPSGGVPDPINTDEAINITMATPYIDNWVTTGVWKVRVIAQNVPAGPQSFGLVVTGDLDVGYGIVMTDKKVYSEEDTINIEVRDSGPLGVFVDVTSDTETTPETIILTETVPGSGIWKGSIDTKLGLPGADGALQVKCGDAITVTYDDTNPVHTSTATAIVGCAGPVITNVAVPEKTNAYAKVTWDTDKPSNSKVYYGETPSLERPPVEVAALQINHEVELVGLKTDTIYYFDVESADWFGHTTRDNNGGKHYTFRTVEKTEILVVFGDETFDREDRYRTALEAYGWTYNEWYADTQGDPPLATLQEYKVVIWQTGYEQYPPITDSQRPLITDYLDGGGRLFLTSHDIAWGLCAPTSQFMSSERCNWFNGTMKVRWMEDPYWWNTIEGILGNAISGDYAPGAIPGPQPYTPHRQGAAGDEVECTATDGICQYTWWNVVDPFNPAAGRIAIQWTSSAINGTPGVGVWGGKPSKMVAFFFEWTRINTAIDDDPVRADILEYVIKWLLGGRNHPDVQVIHPNGGETFAGNSVSIDWTASTVGTQIHEQALYYSDNAGQSWNHIANVGNATPPYDWDISMRPNGNKYMVKVVVQDDGDPRLIGADASDSTFSILRPGGDNEGPITIPGSVKVQPNYLDSGSTVWFNATVDDSNRGNSTIATAEYFIQCTEPEIADFGGPNSTAMTASDGSFDTPIEDVTWSNIYVNTSGWYTLWVHGQDVAGNWGPFESTKFLVLDGVNPVDLTPPAPPTNVGIALEGASLEHLNITWDPSPDDDGNPANVQFYDIYYSESYVRDRTGYKTLASIPRSGLPNYYHVDALRGNGDPNSYFYYVSARDQSCNEGVNETQVAKYNRVLTAGKNLISIPLMLLDESVDVVLQTALADIEVAWYYDATDLIDPWKSYNPVKQANDLATVNHTMGLWIKALADTNIVVVGQIHLNTTIFLQAGWNLVGYPSFIWRSVTDALSGVGPYSVEAFDMTNPPEYLQRYSGSDTMMTGDGYWIKVDAPTAFSLQN